MDWNAWHDQYEDPASWMARRLGTVQENIRAALDEAPPGALTAISLCAGQGRDLLGVLAGHHRRDDVRARLVELDPRNTAAASARAEAAGLRGVEVVTGDAALVDHYAGPAPADLVLVCGVFGNITDADVQRTVEACAGLCKTGGTVVWTRHRGAPDLVPAIRDWFAKQDFELLRLTPAEEEYCVGMHRFTGTPRPLHPGDRLFEFIGYDKLASMRNQAHEPSLHES